MTKEKERFCYASSIQAPFDLECRIGNFDAIKHAYALGKQSRRSASKDSNIRTGDILMSVNQVSVTSVDDATKKIEAASLTETTMLGLYCTQATMFHETIPVDANHARRYWVKINSPWLMSIRKEEMDSKQCFIVSSVDEPGPALQCGIKKGGLLLEVNGHDVQDKDFDAKMIHNCQSADSNNLVMSRPTLPVTACTLTFSVAVS